ncbi:hypothetical protein [Kluyvera sp. 142486]|uniref:hypothetical protein n=1 Tax=Kluyvera sp. 142486 TaxID=3390050 RepID=UPI00397FDFA3
MKTKTLFAAVAAALILSACAPKTTARNCDQAVEVAYHFTERAISLRPDLAFSPVRNETDDALFWLACRDGVRKGKTHDETRLVALQEYITEAAEQPDLTPEDGRYLVGNMAMYLAHLYGFESVNS